MIKFVIGLLIIIGLVLAAPYGYRQYIIWDAGNPTDDASTINRLLIAFTPRVTGFDVNQSIELNLTTPIIDIRTEQEFDAGHLPNAVLVPEQTIYKEFPAKYPELNIKVYVYGNTEAQAAVAVRLLRDMGYAAFYLERGFEGWKRTGYVIEKTNSLYF